MNAKILLIAISAAAFSSCSTAYKSGQTPDDVYYSPVRPIEERNDNRKRDEVKPDENTTANNRIRMVIRDRRWREFDNDYDYSYNNSPYRYCYSSYNSYGYYYNPYYYSKPVYYGGITPSAPVNHTPRMVNLNSYTNYKAAVVSNTKTGTTSTSPSYIRQYNNSNNSGSKLGNLLRQVITPTPVNTNTNSSSNNNTRTYTPANNNNSSSTPSSSGSGSGSGSSSSGSVSRPGRG